MQILFINNHGGGFADYVEVAEDTSVEAFFKQRLPDAVPSDFLIRVNRQPVARDTLLHPGDRITVTPTKIEGAG